MTVIRTALKAAGVLAVLAVLLAACYLAFNWPFGARYKKIAPSELKTYFDYLDSHVSDPLSFISQKFREYDIVLIGEIHRRKQDVDFVKALIPYLYEKNGITVFAWQFGASDFQGEVDALVNAPEFDERKAIGLMRRWTYFWNYEDYLDIYRVIWRINKAIPAGQEKIRFLQLGSAYLERKYNSPDRSVRIQERKRFNYSKKMAEIMEREVLSRGKKALWYSGLHHALTGYRQPRFFFRHYRRGGNVLYERYPKQIYSICLHSPVESRGGKFKEEVIGLPLAVRFYYPFGGVIDKIYDQRKRPFAFDAHSSPLGKLKDDYSYYSVDQWRGIRLADFCDGYIVPCSFREAEPVTPITNWIPSQAEFKEVKDTLLPGHAAQIKSIPDFLESLNENTLRIFKSRHEVDDEGRDRSPLGRSADGK